MLDRRRLAVSQRSSAGNRRRLALDRRHSADCSAEVRVTESGHCLSYSLLRTAAGGGGGAFADDLGRRGGLGEMKESATCGTGRVRGWGWGGGGRQCSVGASARVTKHASVPPPRAHTHDLYKGGGGSSGDNFVREILGTPPMFVRGHQTRGTSPPNCPLSAVRLFVTSGHLARSGVRRWSSSRTLVSLGRVQKRTYPATATPEDAQGTRSRRYPKWRKKFRGDIFGPKLKNETFPHDMSADESPPPPR